MIMDIIIRDDMKTLRTDKQHIEYMAITMTSVIVFLALMAMFIGKYLWSDNVYNSYTLQAVSWLYGHLDLGQDYGHLELAIYNGKYYVSFPPFPSYVMLPFALIFGENTPDYLILYIFDLLGVLYLYKVAAYFKLKPYQCMISALLSFIGSNVVFVMLNPYVWFIAQMMCFTLSIMSIYYALNGRNALALAFWACAVGCRPMQAVLIIPLIILMLRVYNEKHADESIISFIKRNLLNVIPAFVIGVSYMALNYARFGNVFQFGHDYLPEFTESEHGQFAIEYIRPNLESLFRLFRFDEEGRMVIDHFNNLSMLIVSPIFIVVIIFAIIVVIDTIIKRRNENAAQDGLNINDIFLVINIVIFSAVYMLMIVMHKTMGGWHFGNRYSNDIIPYFYLILLVITSKKPSLVKWEIPFLIWGVVLNSVGSVIVYNVLG